MAVISVKELLEAGVHFGHQTRKWNPKMAEYIFGEKNGIHILNLDKTAEKFIEAYNFIKETVSNGGDVLFIGTKKQAQEIIANSAKPVGAFYINARWLGGLLTNFQTIKKRIDHLKSLEAMEADGSINLRPKKEILLLRKEHERLNKYLGGIKDMKNLPHVIFVVDPKKEEIAVKEAKKLKIPIVAVVDTNCDPEMVDYCIPANDDAIKSITLIIERMANAVAEGRDQMVQNMNIKIKAKEAAEETKNKTEKKNKE